MAASSLMVPLGTPAPDFKLPSVDGPHVALSDLEGPALLVLFLCNHCPYVRHVERTLAATVAEYAERGVAAVGICSNDTDAYPTDGPAGLAASAYACFRTTHIRWTTVIVLAAASAQRVTSSRIGRSKIALKPVITRIATRRSARSARRSRRSAWASWRRSSR